MIIVQYPCGAAEEYETDKKLDLPRSWRRVDNRIIDEGDYPCQYSIKDAPPLRPENDDDDGDGVQNF
jgi:hypothetical protein